MKRRFYFFTGVLVLLWLAGCRDAVVNAPNTFTAPETRLVVDTINVVQKSTVRFQWSGEVPDGFVGGYFVSFDKQNWTFTRSQDSTFNLTLFSLDTTYTLYVSACRTDGGNKVYDTASPRGAINFGREPFTDLDANGTRSDNEPFTDIGLIDESPAELRVPIENSPPKLDFTTGSDVPDSTFPAVQFTLQVSDPDGNSTIDRIELSLNDSLFLNPLRITGINDLLILTIEARDPRSSTTDANVYLGSNPTALTTPLKNFRLDNTNVLYARVFDAAGAVNDTLRSMPRKRDTVGWYARRVTSTLLIVDGYGDVSRDPFQSTIAADGFMRDSVMTKILNGKFSGANRYQTLEIKRYIIASGVLQRILGFYDISFWYNDLRAAASDPADNALSLDLAQSVLPALLAGGKYALMCVASNSTSINTNALGFSTAQTFTVVNAVSDTTKPLSLKTRFVREDAGYPEIIYNGIALVPGFLLNGMLLQPGAEPIYRLPNTAQGSANYVCARRRYTNLQGLETGRLIFCTAGMFKPVRTESGSTTTNFTALRAFYEKVFKDEFNQVPL